MKCEQLLKNPIRFKAMTGSTIEKFEELLPAFTEIYDEYLSKYELKGNPRKGVRSFVKNSLLDSHRGRVVFILSYIKLNPLQESHDDLFLMQQKQCNELA